MARFLDCWGAGPYRIAFACEDLDATEELLRHNGVRGLERSGDCLNVSPEAAQGVRMSFVQA